MHNCLAGFNSTIFAYGQTSAGKTHTMLGQVPLAPEDMPEQVRTCSPRAGPGPVQLCCLQRPALGLVQPHCHAACLHLHCSFSKVHQHSSDASCEFHTSCQ